MRSLLVRQLALLCVIYIGILTAFLTFYSNQETSNSEREFLVILNELKQQIKQTDDSQHIDDAFLAARESVLHNEVIFAQSKQKEIIQGVMILTIAYILLVFVYIYWKILRPFHILEQYAQSIASGKLDQSLEMERTNFFGAFTWAFDHMRKELQYAKTKEQAAIQENKTIIATLSHDIKTPIASIRAYAEGLEANLDGSYEQRARYTNVIMKKCDEVSALTNDLMLHSLSELDHLEINMTPHDLGEIIEQTLQDMEYPHLQIQGSIPHKTVDIDKKRFAQILENICNNARKYAPDQPVKIWATSRDEEYVLHIKDHGEGIPPENLPFVFHKFYRGSNVQNQEGSGLGLYIVKTLLTQMNGDIQLVNHQDGLEVIITLYEKD